MGFFTGGNDDDDKDHIKDLKKNLDSLSSTVIGTVKGASSVTNELIDRSAEVWDYTKAHADTLKSIIDEEAGFEDLKALPGLVTDTLGAFFEDEDAGLTKLNLMISAWPSILPFKRNTQITSDVGLFAYPTPTPELYDACKVKEGLAGWDHHGYWRCLFPRASIPALFLEQKDLLTKEFVEQCPRSQSGADTVYETPNQGRFFTGFGAYMDWSSSMRKVQNQERLGKLKKLQEKKEELVSLWNEKQPVELADKVITSTVTSSSTVLKDGNRETVTKTSQYFSDGSSLVREVTQCQKAGSDHTETHETVTETPSKKLWF